MLAGELCLYIAQNYRIAVDSSNPGAHWIACIDNESLMPNGDELTQIRSYIEFDATRCYKGKNRKKILEGENLAFRKGHNTSILRKGLRHGSPDNGWRYRKGLWSADQPFIPSGNEMGYRPYGIIVILDLIEIKESPKGIKAWDKWKKKHPDIFNKF
jgi:hypothetical protein